MSRRYGILNRGGVPLLPGNHSFGDQGGGRVLSGSELAPELSDGGYGGGGYRRAAGMPMAPATSRMDPSSPTFDPSARTRTQSSYNFRQSVLNNNALAKAKSAAVAAQRAGQRVAGVQSPSAVASATAANAATATPSPGAPAAATGFMSAGDDAGETVGPTGIQAAPMPGMPVGGNLNPYVGFQGPGSYVPQRPLSPTGEASVAAQSGYAASGLPAQAYADRSQAMDAGPGRIHAVLPADMAANLASNSLRRDDQRITPTFDGNSIVNRYVAPGVPAGYGPNAIEQAALGAKAQYLDAQAAGQNALAGNPDPQERGLQATLATAQADAIRSNAGESGDLRKENDRLSNQNRLFQEQGTRAEATGVAANQRASAAAMNNLYKTMTNLTLDDATRNQASEAYHAMLANIHDGRQSETPAQRQSAGLPASGGATSGKAITPEVRDQIWKEAGGDVNKANMLAMQRGYNPFQ